MDLEPHFYYNIWLGPFYYMCQSTLSIVVQFIVVPVLFYMCVNKNLEKIEGIS